MLLPAAFGRRRGLRTAGDADRQGGSAGPRRGGEHPRRKDRRRPAAPAGQTPTPDAGRRVNGMGTGVVIDPRGYIVTNHHVVDGVREILVTLADGRRHVAKLVARDLETDLARDQDRRAGCRCR